MGAAGAALLVSPTLKLGDWALRLGVFFILLAYGFAWQAVRRIYGRPPSPLLVVAPTLLWLILSMTVLTKSWDLLVVNAVIRRGLVALFSGLSAYEFWRSRHTEDLRSRRVLFWVFATFGALNAVRIPFVSILPAPLGAAPTEAWSVVIYNLEAVILVLLASVFMIVLSRERMSSRNYGLALRDAMTNVYNRRAYHEHMQALGTNGEGLVPPYALLVLDIDRFKSINDRFGHQLGDKVIVLAAQTAEAALRKHDSVFRLGGEEFACLLPDTGLLEAL
jgi:predicted signal transduction protein with EAL and GGDEF domain